MNDQRTDFLVKRIKQARALLEWWEATNHPDDRDTGLAIDTRRWLAYLDVSVPPLASGSDLYATAEDDEPSQPPPQPGHTDTTALSVAHELHHVQLRRMGVLDEGSDAHHKTDASTPRTESDSSSQQILSRMD